MEVCSTSSPARSHRTGRGGGDTSPAGSHQITELLQKWREGDPEALNSLMPLVYDELRRVARRYLQQERREHTLEATALVHEAYLRLVDAPAPFQNRQHFYAIAAQLMRQILVDHARSRSAAKRKYGYKLTVDQSLGLPQPANVDLLALDDALTQLARLSSRQARIVELRFFGGLSIEETAEVLGVSSATVERDWTHARAWLYREMTRSEPS
jgi:RNA polymerase sigma factor (TIGR02999 family)